MGAEFRQRERLAQQLARHRNVPRKCSSDERHALLHKRLVELLVLSSRAVLTPAHLQHIALGQYTFMISSMGYAALLQQGVIR